MPNQNEEALKALKCLYIEAMQYVIKYCHPSWEDITKQNYDKVRSALEVTKKPSLQEVLMTMNKAPDSEQAMEALELLELRTVKSDKDDSWWMLYELIKSFLESSKNPSKAQEVD